MGLHEIVTNVNLSNKDQIQNLKTDVITESNAVFSANGVFSVMSGNILQDIKEMIVLHADNQSTVVEAYLKKDKDML